MQEHINNLSSVDDSSSIFKSVIVLMMLFIASVWVVYFAPLSFSKIFFGGVLLIFWISKKDYFWFIYFFILSQAPGYFFANYSADALYRLPLYTIMGNFSFSPIDFFVVLSLIKAKIKGNPMQLQLQKPLLMVALYMIISIFTTSIFFSTSLKLIAWHFRWIFYYSIIISLCYLIDKVNALYRTAYLLSPFIFFLLFTQLYYLIRANQFITLFDTSFKVMTLNTVSGELRPGQEAVLIIFLGLIFSLISLERTRSRTAKWYLYLIIFTSFFSIYISATRVWFVMFSFILIGYLIISRKKFASFANIILISCLLIIILINSGIVTTDFLLRSSWQRLSQVFDIALGNIRETDTSAQGRFFDELPIMLSIIKQNPLIGYGYSNVTMIYSNNNFGFLNTIIMFGIVGFSLFIYLFMKYFAMITDVVKNIDKSNPLARSIKIIGISWASILIGYFSTWDFFSLYFQKTFFISIVIAITELFVHDAKEEIFVESSNNELLNLQPIKYKRIPYDIQT